MESDRRYFIVHFTGLDKERERQRGKIHMFVENMGYVNEKFIHQSIREDFNLDDPYIERVEELDEVDFYDFISDEVRSSGESEPKKDNLDEFL